MKLRPRLFLTTLLVAVPPIVLLVIADGWSRHDAAETRLIEVLRGTIEREGAQGRCEADPGGWAEEGGRAPREGEGRGPPHDRRGPHGPGRFEEEEVKRPTLWVYAADGTIQNPPGPPLVAPELPPGSIVALDDPWYSARIAVLGRTEWDDGPCVWVVAEGSTVPGWFGSILPPTYVWLAPVLAVLGTVLLAAGPVVTRIRRMTAAVRATEPLAAQVGGDDELTELAVAFDEAHAALQARIVAQEAQEKALREFLSNTTHDVMIPLTVLQGHLAALRDGGDPAAPLAGAMTESHYIASLLKNLGVVARLDALTPRLDRAPVDLGALVSRVVARHRPVATQVGVELDAAVPADPLVVPGDVTLLEQAVGNVVDNAVRYNQPGGHVAVVLEAVGTGFVLRVVDDGPGVPAEALARLTERGARLDEARTRAPGGQGLGLNITRRVVELHGWSLRLGASEYGGLEVEVRGGP